MRTAALTLALALLAPYLGLASAALAEDVSAEELLRLGIPVTPRGYRAQQGTAGAAAKPILQTLDAVRADVAEGGGSELAVLAHVAWVSTARNLESARSLTVYRQARGRWVVWSDLELPWPAWADLARLDARVLEAGERPRLVITYSSGGSFGGEVIDVFAHSAGAWQRTRSPVALYYGLKDIDGDGVWELLEGLLLPAGLALPSNARRPLWWWILRYHDRKIVDCSRAFRSFYADRVRGVTARLVRLAEGGGAPLERSRLTCYQAVYADELLRLQRLLAGQDPFRGAEAPFGGPVRPIDKRAVSRGLPD